MFVCNRLKANHASINAMKLLKDGETFTDRKRVNPGFMLRVSPLLRCGQRRLSRWSRV